MKNLPKIFNRIHFIGIGGIGVSALAQYYLEKGHKVSGSDLACSEIIEALRKKRVKVFIGHSEKNIITKTNLVIYSSAVQEDNPEMKKAKKLKIKIQSYPQALGELTKQHFTIAVVGTHGKSTTTTMIGLLLIKAGLDPTIIVGTKVKELGNSNYRVGKSQYLVIEACEYEESFLNYFSDIAVITNIEADHLDYFKNFNNVKKAFAKFAKKLKKDGILITEGEETSSLLHTKGYKNTEDAKKLKKILKVPGEHNIFNALAALAVARALKIPDKISYKALSEYKGCWRRFEVKKGIINKKEIIVVSDYGHHPTEVKATLKAAREKWPKKKTRGSCRRRDFVSSSHFAPSRGSCIWCVFQPHQYHRTYHLFDDFVKIFRQTQDKFLIDKIIITDIYTVTGREKESIKKRVNSEKLVKAIKRKDVIYLPKEKIINYLKNNLQVDETSSHLEPFADARVSEKVVIIMGAGDIYKLVTRMQ